MNMSKFSKLVLSFIVLCLSASSLFSTALSKEPLTFAIGFFAGAEPREDSLLFQEWQKRTGVEIKLIKMESSGIGEKINTMLASGDLPDIMTCNRDIANNYGPQGAFIPINKYFDKAPNIKKYFDVKKNPWLYGPGGNIYILTQTGPYLEWCWTWNKKWASKLGLSAPKTVEDWVKAWEKVKASDPSAIPVITRSTKPIELLYRFFFPVWWGITSDGFIIEKGRLRDPWLTPEMKGLISFLHDIYAKGLLYREFPTATWDSVTQAIAQGKVFSVLDYQSVAYQTMKIPMDIVESYEPLFPPKGPYGKSGCDWFGPTSYTGIAITSKCKDIDSALKFLDYLWSREGPYFYYFGIKGLTYEVKKGGEIAYTQKVIDEASKAKKDVLSHLQSYYNIYLYYINVSPLEPKLHVLSDIAQKKPEGYIKGKAIVAMNLAKPRPPIWLTMDEQKRLNSLNANISTYRDEWVFKFILGTEPLTKWDEFVAGLKKIGAEEAESINNAGYERYLKFVGKPKGYVPLVRYDLLGLDKLVGISK